VAPSEPVPSATPRDIADDPGAVALEIVAEGLAAPIGIATAPDGWLLVHERNGRAVAVDTTSGAVRLALDLTDRVLGGGEQGLLGLVLHPGWPEVPRGFVHYSDLDGNTVLAEVAGRVEDGAPFLDPRTERVLLRVQQPFANHNGGQLAFGPDGYLWLALGDGGSGGDPNGHGQDTATLLGSILRIDVDDSAGDRPYAIPPDNPFAAGGGAPEIHLFGVRNPWRLSFDPVTDEVWIADVGQGAWEEVNRLDPVADGGANLGWNLMEGTHCFADDACTGDGLVLPVTEYDHGAGCSVTGGEVYRGSAIPSLWGWYVFSDFCSGTVFGVRSDTPAAVPGQPATAPRVLLETDASVSAFGVDTDGELYLADIGDGIVYRIVGG
jgi:glucose/arabinose dehydrogenase